ncbi:ubiquitin-binding protein cue5 [Microsporum ferrugineum]
MAETDKVGTTPKKAPAGTINPESPTTARPLDFDDEPQETGLTSINSRSSSQLNLASQAAGMQSQRPPNPHQRIIDDLKEAFPNIDGPVIKAVVVASDGNVEKAFNALLGMSDPDAQEDVRPPMPPRPAVGGVPTSTTQSQLEDDERYARQLAEHYSGADQRRGYQQSPWDHGMASGQRGQGLKPNELYDREHSFIDDDLPIIKENIRKGFLETQSRVNTWVENFKRRLDGEDSDEDVQHGQRQYGQRQQHANAYNDQGYPNRRSAEHRRSVDRERYDADPHVLGDDFSSLELRDNEAPPPRPPRPQANPDLFKAKSASPDRRKVSFQEGPPEEIQDSYSAPNPRATSVNKPSKWQPLSSVEPSPVADNDPFSLGDSDDEKDTKPKDAKTEEANGKKATAEAAAGKGDQSKAAKDSI